ncbi:MAG: DNA-3-methyladenine glycosylase I [Chloroflexi bacterium]|nr:DNA-3-methyladenine glycosylase I [Chloroflexota bacterium]
MTRCAWVNGNEPLYVQYHDEEWGVPIRDDDRRLFERLCLEGAQAGLSWLTILRKRDHYRLVYDGFDPEKVARYDDAKVAALLADAGIVRNRAKVASTINNARCVLALQDELGSFSDFLWSFVGGQTRHNTWASMSELPAETTESRAMSKALKSRGFSFVGPTICYAMMQATGMVNDHTVDCFRYAMVTSSHK